MIYHICTYSDWQKALKIGQYTPPGFQSDGFIHCSKLNQVLSVANRFFRGQADLLLLEINPDETGVSLWYENLEGGKELFPHLYGVLDLRAVKKAIPFPALPDGTFILPSERL